MPAVKRESSPSSSSPSSAENTPRKQRTPKKGDSDKPKREVVKWTSQEDEVFMDLLLEVLKDHLYAKVKSDGRIGRGSSAVKAHYVAMVSQNLRSKEVDMIIIKKRRSISSCTSMVLAARQS